MDGGGNAADTLLQNFNLLRDALFSEQTLRLLNTHVLSPSAPLQVLRRQALDLLATLLALMAPVVAPLLDRLGRALHDSPDIVVLVLVAALVFVALRFLAWVRRMVLWVTGLVVRVVFWACVVAGAAWAYQRGLERTVRDVVVVASKVAGYGAALKDVWVSEYRRYEAQENHGRGR